VHIERLTMVYDADGGLRGELAYLVGTLRGNHCALCDITHSGIRRKGAFDELTCSLSVPVEVVHRNEQSPEVARFTAANGGGAVVVAHTEAGLKVLMDDRALTDCQGDVDAFARELSSQIADLEAESAEEAPNRP
jgi:hypothetical protein